MNFIKTPSFVKLLYPGLVWDMRKTAAKTLYLTFDDGPVPEVTPFVLDTLAAYHAKATFFCVGENVERFPKIFRQIESAGHSTGNHTYQHLNGWKTGTKQYVENVARCRKALTEAGLSPPASPLFRPPYGKISRRQIRILRQDYRIIMWDILAGDYDAGFPAEQCLQKSIQHSRSGSIIIFHDSYKAARNLQYVLPRYLEHFAAAGYQFAAL